MTYWHPSRLDKKADIKHYVVCEEITKSLTIRYQSKYKAPLDVTEDGENENEKEEDVEEKNKEQIEESHSKSTQAPRTTLKQKNSLKHTIVVRNKETESKDKDKYPHEPITHITQ